MSTSTAPERLPLALVVVSAEASFTLDGLCRACGSERATLIALVEEGILDPAGTDPESWRFPNRALHTARIAKRLTDDMELDLAGLALVLDLLTRIDLLEARLQRCGSR